jgi:endonuclease/exonuclease/phosphatase family metal-dependent hydrolase
MARARSPMTWLKIAAWALAYAIVAPLAALEKRPRLLALAIVVATAATFALSARVTCGHRLRIATFNIQELGKRKTDMAKTSALVASLDADIVAVQEIQSDAHFRELAEKASRGARAYRTAVSRCGGKSDMRLGFLYDERSVELLSTKEYPELAPGGGGRCGDDRPGLLGVFQREARTVHLLAIHFAAMSDANAYKKRQMQWDRAHKIVAQLRANGADSVMILGDANSTGYRDDTRGERTFVDERARKAGMDVETSGIACSEYFMDDDAGVLTPSLLDHAVATPGLVARGSARVHGFCASLKCAPHRSPTPPDDFNAISDHCPVTVDLTR